MTADIETETHKNVLTVPAQSVTTRMPKKKNEENSEMNKKKNHSK